MCFSSNAKVQSTVELSTAASLVETDPDVLTIPMAESHSVNLKATLEKIADWPPAEDSGGQNVTPQHKSSQAKKLLVILTIYS